MKNEAKITLSLWRNNQLVQGSIDISIDELLIEDSEANVQRKAETLIREAFHRLIRKIREKENK